MSNVEHIETQIFYQTQMMRNQATKYNSVKALTFILKLIQLIKMRQGKLDATDEDGKNYWNFRLGVTL